MHTQNKLITTKDIPFNIGWYEVKCDQPLGTYIKYVDTRMGKIIYVGKMHEKLQLGCTSARISYQEHLLEWKIFVSGTHPI